MIGHPFLKSHASISKYEVIDPTQVFFGLLSPLALKRKDVRNGILKVQYEKDSIDLCQSINLILTKILI